MRGRAVFHHQSLQSYGRFSRINHAVFWGKINTQIEDFEQFFVSKQGL